MLSVAGMNRYERKPVPRYVSGPVRSQFGELARYYDSLNDGKDYRAEAERLESLARRFGPPGRTSWLDVACGTGRHLEFLRREHPVVGLDRSREMLQIARRRLPGVQLVLGDMRSFHLRRQFNVVSCLFSAIGHLATPRDVKRTFTTFARHLTPGGIAIVEPWLDPSVVREGMIHLRVHESPELSVVRCAFSTRRQNHTIIRYEYLVGEAGVGIRRYRVTDIGLLMSRTELLETMQSAGLAPRFIEKGLTQGRGLLLGIKPNGG